MQSSTATDQAVAAADNSAHTAQAASQLQSRMQDTSMQQEQQQEPVEKSYHVEVQAALFKPQSSLPDEQQQQEAKSTWLQRPLSLQQVQLAAKRRHSQSQRTELRSSPTVKSEPAFGDESALASTSTPMCQPVLIKQQQQQQQVPHEPMQTQPKAEAQQQQQQQQVPALQQPLQQQHVDRQRQQQQELQQLQALQAATLLQQQQRIESQQQQQQHRGATMSFDSNRSAATVVHYTTSISQHRVGALSEDQLAASSPGAVLRPIGTAGGIAERQPPAVAANPAGASNASTVTAAAAAAAAAAGELNVSSNTSPSQLMQMIVDQARKMRAEQARKAKDLSRANKKLQKLQHQKAELQAELESQGAFEGIDIDNITVQQLQEMVAKVAEQRREVAEQLAAEERELEIQQKVLHDLQERDREMDARLQRELMERLELLQQFVQDRMVE